MCGITGIMAFNEIGRFHMINLSEATDKLAQRGPDGRGIFNTERVGLGHRRLAIIDTTSDGNQPMSDESKRYTIVFNGEIFNFKELKKELIDKGISFFSNSDTEVLLKLFVCLNLRIKNIELLLKMGLVELQLISSTQFHINILELMQEKGIT